MSLEESAAQSNSLYFLPEFTFSNTTFSPTSGTELELADGLIWIDDKAVVFQMKERAASEKSLSDQEKWFENKVVKKATKQIKDTLKYLDTNQTVIAKNRRGQSIPLTRSSLTELHKIVLYSCEGPFSYRPCHVSSTAGFIHLFNAKDYDGMLRTLFTPGELFEYLKWREQQLTLRIQAQELPEQALLGHYLLGDFETEPSLDDIKYVFSIQQNIEDWDISGILHRFLERSYDGIGDTNYHRILAEIAKLDRSGLRLFKERFKLSMDWAKKNSSVLPYRFSIPRTDCGFVFIPLEKQFRGDRKQALVNLTHANKYDQKVSRCIGLTFLADDDGWFTVDWCSLDYPWEFNAEMDQMLKNSFPFRTTKQTSTSRYTFLT